MNATLIGLLALAAVVVALYFLAPTGFANVVRRATRRVCGLSTRSIRIDGIDWPFLEGGKRDAEPLVMVHGFCADKDHWTVYARAFTARYRVIVPDLPGFGDNTKDPSFTYGTREQAAHLRDFLRALNVGRCHLVGNSMGGFIGLRYALKYPADVISVAVFNSAGVTSGSKSALEIAADGGSNPFQVASVDDVDRLLAMATHRKIPMPGALRRAAAREFRAHSAFHDRLFWSLVEEIRHQPLDEALPRICIPTLILWGQFDRLVDVSCAHIMARAIPDSRLIVLDDVGHLPMLEAPRVTAAHHLAFLDGITHGGAVAAAQRISPTR